MFDEKRPEWVENTLRKFVSKGDGVGSLPSLGRNVQPEITRLQAVIEVVANHEISASELTRLKSKVQMLLRILESKQ